MKKPHLVKVCLIFISLSAIIFSLLILSPFYFRHDHGDRVPAVACANNLKQIGLALHFYAHDHAGAFPESLLNLYPEYIQDAKTFYCPGEYKKKPLPQALLPEQFSYTYTPGLSENLSPDLVLAVDKSPDNHRGKSINILYLDGHVGRE